MSAFRKCANCGRVIPSDNESTLCRTCESITTPRAMLAEKNKRALLRALRNAVIFGVIFVGLRYQLYPMGYLWAKGLSLYFLICGGAYIVITLLNCLAAIIKLNKIIKEMDARLDDPAALRRYVQELKQR